MQTVNIKTIKKCAFCKYWYDPTNSAIKPRSPKINLWEYDDKAKCMCLKKNFEMHSSAFCGDYELKLNIMQEDYEKSKIHERIRNKRMIYYVRGKIEEVLKKPEI